MRNTESLKQMALTVIVPGAVVSTNESGRTIVAGRIRKGEDAREYAERVKSRALAAAVLAGWTMPQCARVALVLWNQRIDASNGIKGAEDALKGIAILDDNPRRVRGVSADHAIDDKGPRLEITITACEPLMRPKATRAKRTPRAAAVATTNERRESGIMTFAERDALLRRQKR